MANLAITVFLTTAGFDVVLSDIATQPANKVDRVRLTYEQPNGVLAGSPINIELCASDTQLKIEYGDSTVFVKQQPKGHFFGFVSPIERAEPISLAQVRARMSSADIPAAF